MTAYLYVTLWRVNYDIEAYQTEVLRLLFT